MSMVVPKHSERKHGPYPEYKNSGVEWLGEIPSNWEVKKLKYVTDVEMGQSPSSEDYAYDNRGIPFLQGNADFTELYPQPIVWCDTANKTTALGDILLSVRAPIAAVNIADQVYGIGRGLCAIHGLKIYQKYLYFIMLCLNKELNSLGTGSTYTAISVDQVGNVVIAVPSNKEQQAIAEFLDQETSRIDELIAKKKKLADLLQEKRTALITRAVTKGLNPDAPMKDSSVEWLGEIPAHWEIKKLKFFSNIVLGKMLESIDNGNHNKRPYLRAQNILWEKVDDSDIREMWFSEKELVQYRLKFDDLLVSEGGEVGRTAIWKNELDECYIQNSVHKVSMQRNYIQHYFLYHFLAYGKAGYFESIVNRVSIAHLTREKLKEVLFLVPSIQEQQAIAHFLAQEIARIDTLISKINEVVEKLQEYCTALITAAVTGKIDVRSHVPREES